jgi:hypothetical protein
MACVDSDGGASVNPLAITCDPGLPVSTLLVGWVLFGRIRKQFDLCEPKNDLMHSPPGRNNGQGSMRFLDGQINFAANSSSG